VEQGSPLGRADVKLQKKQIEMILAAEMPLKQGEQK
jgi:hypothetical protein